MFIHECIQILLIQAYYDDTITQKNWRGCVIPSVYTVIVAWSTILNFYMIWVKRALCHDSQGLGWCSVQPLIEVNFKINPQRLLLSLLLSDDGNHSQACTHTEAFLVGGGALKICTDRPLYVCLCLCVCVCVCVCVPMHAGTSVNKHGG